jgi:hypothetical protein
VTDSWRFLSARLESEWTPNGAQPPFVKKGPKGRKCTAEKPAGSRSGVTLIAGGVLRNHANKSRPFLASSQPRISPLDAGHGRALGALADTEFRCSSLGGPLRSLPTL